MPEIKYKALKEYLIDLAGDREKDPFPPVCLLYGEELLYKGAFEELLDAMVPASKRSFNYEPVDGTNENIHDVIERLNTFSLSPGLKVIAIRDARVFHSKQDSDSILEKAREVYDKNEMKKAARYLVSLLALLNLSFEDIPQGKRKQSLKLDTDRWGDDEWLDDIIAYCRDNGQRIPAGQDEAGVLQKAIEKGFPRGNHLIITTDMVDKRRSLFKTIQKTGLIIDCAVPKGDRRADRMAQEAVLKEKMDAILVQNGKKMDRGAYAALYEMTGFDIRTFCNNLEKLVSYVGGRGKITADDVASVLKRTKKDPIYELTAAISERGVEEALFYLDSLLSDNFHPLQILAAITNQIRKLLVIKDFAESPQGRGWHQGLGYGDFKSHIMPAIQDYDRGIRERLQVWDRMISGEAQAASGKKKKKTGKKKSGGGTDLLIAKNPGNPYPVYQTLLKAEGFTKADLIKSLGCLNKADVQLKSTGQAPRLVLEKAIFCICRPP